MTFPVENSTVSFWRAQPHALDNHRSSIDLPAEADIVVIGSGYAGASITHHLLRQTNKAGKVPSIVILEAREVCSGATGRNGGHLKPDPYYRPAAVLAKHGKEAAEEVAAFEALQVGAIKDLVESENIDCDFVLTRTSDVCLYDEARDDLKRGLDTLAAAGVSTVKDVFFSNGKTAEGVSGVKGAKGCFSYSAGTVWPYKLIVHLLSKAIANGVNLQTHTPVQSISAAAGRGTERPWTVNTARGSICTSKIIHASNANVSNLLPEFSTRIVPVRGICCRIVPAKEHSPVLTNSYILRIAPGEYDYLIPRSDGSIIVGGARQGFWRDLSQWYNVVDDSQLIEPAKNYFDGYMQRYFRGWEDSGAYTDRIWTGIMGYSSDGFPHVGEVPGRSGQFVCAGFTGHGMPQIFLSAKALASMVLGKREDIQLPQLYRTSQQRLDLTVNATLEAWEANLKKIGSKL